MSRPAFATINIVFFIDLKNLQAIHNFCGHHRISHTLKYGYRHQNRDSVRAETQAMAQYLISYILVAAILNMTANM